MSVSSLAAIATAANTAMAQNDMSMAMARQQLQSEQAVTKLVSDAADQGKASAPSSAGSRILDIEV